MLYSKLVLTTMLLAIVSGVFAQSQEIEGDNIQDALIIKNAGTAGIHVIEPRGHGIVSQLAGASAGYFTTNKSSTYPCIEVGQLNPSKDYHVIRLFGSRIIGSTEDILIDIDSDTNNTSEDPNSFKVIHGDKDDPVFLVDQDGNTKADGNLSAKRILANNLDDTKPDLLLGGPNAIINNSSINSNLQINSTGHVTVKIGELDGTNVSKFSILDQTDQEAFSVDEFGTTRVYGTLVTSDKNKKENISPVSSKDLLSKLVKMPIYKWNYKKKNRQHIGPMAQDFLEAFKLGNDETTISSIDADGISLAAIKGLYEVMQEELAAKSTEINNLRERIAALEGK